MIIKFKRLGLGHREKTVAIIKLALCFLAGVLFAVLLFELFFAL